MKNLSIIFVFLLAFTLICQSKVNAGGPLVVKGGMSITYGTRPLTYRFDKGTLGIFSNAEAVALIQGLYSNWEAVSTSEVTFEQDNPGTLDFDVTETNFDSILNSPSLLGYTPIIFDTNGKLLDAFLGSGAGSSVLGLSGPVTVSSGPLVNQIAESQAIFNGRFVNGTDTLSDPESTVDSFKGTVIHETGHGFGLDHAQINVEAIRPGATQETRNAVPLMFPVAVNDLFIIRRDDASAASLLYPNQSQLTGFGKIEGKLFRSDGMTPVLGGNIIARNVNDPTLEAISCVSDYLNTGTGSYTLFAVPPGDYTIEIEPIDLSFTGGSGVGPFTASKSDISFQNPVPKGYYTGPNLPITEDKSQALIVNVQANQTVSNANILASTSAGSSSSTSGSGTNTDEVEPNDLVSQAQVITLPTTVSGSASSTDSGEIELSSDADAMITISDLYKFTLTESGSINALLTIESESQNDDLDLVLFNSDASDILDTSSQSGNTDELISKALQPGTYILGVGAFSGSAAYTLKINLFTSGNSSGGTPVLSLSAPESLILKSTGMNKLPVTVEISNFSNPSKCKVFTTTNSGITIKSKPAKFSLSQSMTNKTFNLMINKLDALNIINSNVADTVTVNVTCSNGANDEIDVSLAPSIESVLDNRSYRYILKRRH